MMALFHPERTHHIDPICGCGIKKCPEWVGIKKAGKRNVYQNIFNRHPEINTIVDSGKDPAWIKEQIANLNGQDIEVKHLVIWKTPYEFLYSLSKRGKEGTFQDLWVEYHLRYFSVVKEIDSINTSILLENPSAVLPEICKHVGVDYIDGQENYWGKNHHNLFGSAAARIHLHDLSSAEFKRLEKYITTKEYALQNKAFDMDKYQKIHFKKKNDNILSPEVLTSIKNNQKVKAIHDMLEYLCVTNVKTKQTESPSLVRFPFKPEFLWYYKSITRRLFLCLFKIKTQIY